MKSLTEIELIFMAKNHDLFHDERGNSLLSKDQKRQFDIFMFGEEFMNSKNKGKKVTYK